MPKIPNNDEFDNKIKEIHGNKILRLENRKSKQTNIKCRCLICETVWMPRIGHLYRGHGCPKCNDIKITPEDFLLKIENIFKGNFIVKEFNKNLAISNQKILMYCVLCKKSRTHSWKHLVNGHGCWTCMRENLIAPQRMTEKEFIERSRQINGGKYNYDKVVNPTQKNSVCITCNIHGDFRQSVGDHLYNKSGCPKCKESKGEKRIRIFFESNNIPYIKNKRFSDCKYKNPLPFDFYLEKLNLLIEFDGEQHTTGFRFYRKKNGGSVIATTKKQKLKGLELIEMRDSIKTEYCIEKNITLLRISYKDYENIEKILNKCVLNL